jgi:hypothetical protein
MIKPRIFLLPFLPLLLLAACSVPQDSQPDSPSAADDWQSGPLLRAAGLTSPSGGDNPVSDLNWVAARNSLGPVELDKANGGGLIKIAGASFNKGLGIYGNSLLRYTINQQCTRLQAKVGINDSRGSVTVGNRGTVIFQVWVDGLKKAESPVMRGGQVAFSIDIQLAAGQTLELRSKDTGDGRAWDYGVWANPTLTCNAPVTDFPILFVTQLPVKADFATIASTFANHNPGMQQAGRGGDLWIRYPDGTLKNLTKAAGYGTTGMQLANAISVRDPSVYWDGTKALFSMVIGAPLQQYQVKTFFWQIYEITGLGQNETPVITKVPNQPSNYNNVSPIYGTDDRIIFTSDRTRNGAAHLYPQHDEYESTPIVTGLWNLNPQNGNLFIMNHAPSGNFTPIIDSYGRVVFTQWDHLKRDQQADADKYSGAGYGTFNYDNEDVNGGKSASRQEFFPEPRVDQEVMGTNVNKFDMNQFFPWTILEDGTESEVLNHLGRHEIGGYIERSFTNDPNVIEYYQQYPRFNQNRISNIFQMRENPLKPGEYFGIDATEFGTHASGQIISMYAPMGLDAAHIAVDYRTHRATAGFNEDNQAADPNNSGHYRDPLPLSNGQFVVAHTSETRAEGGPAGSRYDFRLKTINTSGSYWVAGQPITPGISKSVQFWDPDTLISYNGPLWELQPVEVRPRSRPSKLLAPIPSVEMQVITQSGIDLNKLKNYLTTNDLALIVTRNVTTRDRMDKQQPYNLKVPLPGGVQTIGTGTAGKIYDAAHLQFFQGDQIRGIGGLASPRAGRRVLAVPMHESNAINSNKTNPSGPVGSVQVFADGSAAAFVPARRAMSWQLTDTTGTPVVRERYWLTFQPGEVRVCTSCHGPSDKDQAGNLAPVNPSQALLDLLTHWKAQNP